MSSKRAARPVPVLAKHNNMNVDNDTSKLTNSPHCVQCSAKFKLTGERCPKPAVRAGVCSRHGAKSSGPQTLEGRQRCSAARTVHGRDTIAKRKERSIIAARLAVLEEVGFALNLMSGSRTRGRRASRAAEAYPELQELIKKLVIERAKPSA
jgi:hypothetical protein